MAQSASPYLTKSEILLLAAVFKVMAPSILDNGKICEEVGCKRGQLPTRMYSLRNKLKSTATLSAQNLNLTANDTALLAAVFRQLKTKGLDQGKLAEELGAKKAQMPTRMYGLRKKLGIDGERGGGVGRTTARARGAARRGGNAEGDGNDGGDDDGDEDEDQDGEVDDGEGESGGEGGGTNGEVMAQSIETDEFEDNVEDQIISEHASALRNSKSTSRITNQYNSTHPLTPELSAAVDDSYNTEGEDFFYDMEDFEYEV